VIWPDAVAGSHTLLGSNPRAQSETDTNPRLYAYCGMIAPVFFGAMVYVEGYLAQGYSQVSQPVSDLGAYSLYGSTATLQNINFWVFGVLVIVFAFGVGKDLPNMGKVPVTLGLFGAMVFLAGVFPDQPTPYPGGVHALVSIIAFISVIICQFLAWQQFGRKAVAGGNWSKYSTYSLVSGILSVGFLILFTASQSSPYLGIAQRLFLTIPWVWIEVVSLKLARA